MHRARSTPSALACAFLLAACIPEEGPLMEPGSDCMECHDGGEARHWTAAGTFGGQGNAVSITDAKGRSFTLRTNQAGNFYTAEPLAFPLRVSVNGAAMPGLVTDGSCNRCHGDGGGGGDRGAPAARGAAASDALPWRAPPGPPRSGA